MNKLGKRVACLRDKDELFFETLIAYLELKSNSGAMIGLEGGGGTTACRKHAKIARRGLYINLNLTMIY